MHRYTLWCGLLLALVAPQPPLHAQAPAPKLIKETWDAAYLEGARAGYFHARVEEVERDGKKLIRTSLAMNLKLKRYKEVVALRMETGCDETAEGKVVGVSMTQFLDKGKLTLAGEVRDGKLLVKSPNDPTGKAVPWNDDALGLYAQDRMYQQRKVKPGDRFDFLNYELALMAPLKVRVVVKDPEEVDLLEVKKDDGKPRVERARKALLRVEAVPDKVEIGGKEIALPSAVSWLDKDFQPARAEMELPGLGRLTLYRTTQAVAEEEGVAPALLPDLGLTSLITLNRAIDAPHEARSIVYRVTVKGDADPASAFCRDGRQQARNVKDSTFELHVKAVREPGPVDRPEEAKEEFLKANFFLDSDDEKVKELARKAAGDEANPWRRAQRIEKWVHDNMTEDNAVGFTTASQIARERKGDCRQHAMLTAAMCRAAGVPARTALGLVYVKLPDRGPVLGFHMWTEVLVKGQWLGLDATLGQGGVGPAHLKISDHSWAGTQTLAPLLPVLRVLGKLSVEVVRVE
jgi:hypothetical protein